MLNSPNELTELFPFDGLINGMSTDFISDQIAMEYNSGCADCTQIKTDDEDVEFDNLSLIQSNESSSSSSIESSSSSSSTQIEIIASPVRPSVRPHSAALPKSPVEDESSWVVRRAMSSHDISLSPMTYSCLSCRSMPRNETLNCSVQRTTPSNNPFTSFSPVHICISNGLTNTDEPMMQKQISFDFELPPAATASYKSDSSCFLDTVISGTNISSSNDEKECCYEMSSSHLPPFPTAEPNRGSFTDKQPNEMTSKHILNATESIVTDPKVVSINDSTNWLLILPWDILNSVFQHLDFRDIHRLRSTCQYLRQKISPSLDFHPSEKCQSEMSNWDLWDTEKDHELLLSPSRFQNRSVSFFSPPEIFYNEAPLNQSKLDCNHLSLGRWWNSLTPQRDVTLIRLLSQSELKTISVEPEFYDCNCHSCCDVRSYHNKDQSPANPTPRISDSNELVRPPFLGDPPNPISPFSLMSVRSLQTAPASLTPVRQTSSSFSRSSDDPSDRRSLRRNSQVFSLRNDDRIIAQIDEPPTDEISPQSLDDQISSNLSPERRLRRLPAFNRRRGLLSTDDTDDDTLSNIPNILIATQQSDSQLTHHDETDEELNRYDQLLQKIQIAKRHAFARFFWIFRLMLLSRNSLQSVDFGTPHFGYQTICDEGSTLPDFPLNLRFLDQHFAFPHLQRLRFGITIDCRYIVPIVDFCEYPRLKDVEILGLSLRYQLGSPQFGKKPTMVFGPQQIFASPVDGGPMWLPALYNGGSDEALQLQERGVYVSREYHYEGTFKDGRNDGFGRMTSKCGETYEGQWKNGRRHGIGVVIQNDGKRLEGEWFRDVLHGRASMEMSDGLRYEGEWVNGALEGWGVLSKHRALLAVGQFMDGRPHGWMICRNAYFDNTTESIINDVPNKKDARNDISKMTTTVEMFNSETIISKVSETDSYLEKNGKIREDFEYTEMEDRSDGKRFEPIDDIMFELDTVMDEFETSQIVLKFDELKPSLLQELCSMPGWKSMWKYHTSSVDIHNASFLLLKKPSTVDDVLLLNPRMMRQTPGLSQHSERPAHEREAGVCSPPDPPIWVEEVIANLNIDQTECEKFTFIDT